MRRGTPGHPGVRRASRPVSPVQSRGWTSQDPRTRHGRRRRRGDSPARRPSTCSRAADRLLGAGEFAKAGSYYQRVVGFDDSAVTAAALLGLGEARYRMDDEDGAVATWKAVLELGETPSTYAGLAEPRRVLCPGRRRPARRCAPTARRTPARRPADKAEIANRLGWLAKESGDPGTAKKYFARARGDGPLIPFTYIIIAATTIVSLTVMLTAEGAGPAPGPLARQGGRRGRGVLAAVDRDPGPLDGRPDPDPPAVQHVRAVPVRARSWSAGTARGRSSRSTSRRRPPPRSRASCSAATRPPVGASGAIFGLFGVLLAADRLHHPVDRASRGLVGQLGFLVLINLVFGFASGGQIDNAAHLGGFFAGLWLGRRPAADPGPDDVGPVAGRRVGRADAGRPAAALRAARRVRGGRGRGGRRARGRDRCPRGDRRRRECGRPPGRGRDARGAATLRAATLGARRPARAG